MILNDRTYGLTVTVQPTAEPVGLSEVKPFSRIDDDDTSQDSPLSLLISSGRQRCEELCDLALMTQTLKMTLDVWPMDGFVRLPRSPVQSVTSVKYMDVNSGVMTTLSASSYTLDITRNPARIVRAWNAYWPPTRWQPASVEVVFVAGYATAAAVPQAIKDRIKVFVQYCNENREQIDDEYLDRLFYPFRVGVT